MVDDNQANLLAVDWSTIPAPEDDGGASHLLNLLVPDLSVTSTRGQSVNLAKLKGTTIVFAYPMTGRPDTALPEGWDFIPGARGCTPQACSFRDLDTELKKAGADRIYGLSTQSTDYQAEAAKRLHLPFELLSDEAGHLRKALNLPVMEVENSTLLKRLTLIVE